MVSPFRSVSRLALAAVLLAGVAVAPRPAAAQDGETLIRDTEIEDILRHDAAPILDAAGIDPKNVQIILIGSKQIQAFAAPRVMAVFTGLIMESDNPNELQGVIAHEVGHLAAGHSFRSGEMSSAGMKPFLLTMGLGVLAAIAGAPDAAAGLASSAQYFGALGAIGYSREQESRADQAGATLLDKAGLSARGLADFFDNFRYQEVFAEARRYRYFQDHPISSDRIEALRNRVDKLPNYGEVDTPDALAEHEIMKAKLIGFMTPQVALTKYDEKARDFPSRYARAIAYYQMKDPDRALKLIDGMLADYGDNPYLWELKGQILFEFGHTAEAVAPQRRSVELKPDAPLLRINLGQTLIALDDRKKVEEGIQELKLALAREEDNAVAWRLLAEAYDKTGQDGMARLATAEYNYNIGDLQQARVFAMRARERLDKGTPEWRRATDIVLVAKPTRDDLRELGREGSIASNQN
ncbi:MAG: M48 family metalloprotease [Phenylobacterium sp.]|uniref:M48 family metalloprotease n=1 Tax=Phenylobacterium sp. TaxID=1871053 RepID=UPI0025EA40CA|nr:M48 family metalloprotease [Phenylobacterium sp.]MBI1197137.1 M48 family metalloprotease [Phenylobacterium sp.]